MEVAAVAKPLLEVLAGTPRRPPPVWLMRQAGRYLPEYRVLRARAPGFLAFCTTPDLAAEATLQPVKRFALDAAILFSDILLLPWALGARVEFAESLGPRLSPLADATGLAALDPARLPEAMAPIRETIRLVRGELAPGVALIGFTGAPFTLCCYMIDGKGGAFPAARRMLREQPDLFAGLIDRLAEAAVPYLIAEAEAGAEVLMLFDSWAGLLPPDLFRRFVIRPTARIVAGVRERFPELPIIGFARGAGMMVGAYARETGLDAVGLDTATDPTIAAASIDNRVALQGNLDPFALLAGGAAMREEASAIVEVLRGRPHIFNLGHGVLPETPPEHVAELVDHIRAGALTPTPLPPGEGNLT
ncbi:MAG: uroporphyrinogen decarboxylase [Acetobacteraceae bacterium]